MQKLWVLDETESASGLVSSSEVLTVHADDGGRLSGTTTVNCTAENSIYAGMVNVVLAYPLPGILG